MTHKKGESWAERAHARLDRAREAAGVDDPTTKSEQKKLESASKAEAKEEGASIPGARGRRRRDRGGEEGSTSSTGSSEPKKKKPKKPTSEKRARVKRSSSKSTKKK